MQCVCAACIYSQPICKSNPLPFAAGGAGVLLLADAFCPSRRCCCCCCESRDGTHSRAWGLRRLLVVVVRPILCGLWLAAQQAAAHNSPPSLVQGLAAP